MTMLTLSVVSMQVCSGQISHNRAKMTAYLKEAAQAGAELVLFPELCLQGYDFYMDPALSWQEKQAASEDLAGESCRVFAKLAQEYHLYVVFGMGERCQERLYNAAIAVNPQGKIVSYRKMHPYAEENQIFGKGDQPVLLPTPWGPVGIGICYDSYQFPELMRYYAYRGARLYLNPTALCQEIELPGSRQAFLNYYRPTLEYGVLANTIFIASANLTGWDRLHYYGGGSMIIGPKVTPFTETDVDCYAGSAEETTEGVYTATLDLALATRRLFVDNPLTGEPDFRPTLYHSFYEKNAKEV